ncbi:phage capsid protein [Halomonas sp. S2151]|uniref:major capsid protein n=1 Tax=Halomonas sp. S2151 TaxID=579478 RepID=UPI0005FA5CC4|nr:phage capsid protein [Halomonas sp. S2151]KJZ17408.1 phage capsid protein [Halomonas sp. S2151]
MPLLVQEAAKLSEADLQRGIIEEIIDKEDLLAVLPFVRTDGKSYDYVREKTLSEAEFLSPYDPVPEGAATFDEVSTKLRILAGDVDIDKFTAETQSDLNDQIAIQLQGKAKGITRKFRRSLAQGDSSVNAKEFDGIDRLVYNDQVIVGGGNAMSFTMLDELLDAVPNGADAIFMTSAHIRALRAMLRATGGLEPAHIMMENFGRPMLTHNGVPILVNDFLNVAQDGEGKRTAPIFAARLNETDGLHGIFGGASAGVRMEEIGTVQNKDAIRYRVKWYAGLALKSTKSLAKVADVAMGESGGPLA